MSVKKSAVAKASVVGLVVYLIWSVVSSWIYSRVEIFGFFTTMIGWANYLVFAGIGALYGAFAWWEGISPQEGRYFRGALLVGLVVSLVAILAYYIALPSSGILNLPVAGPGMETTPVLERTVRIARIVSPLFFAAISSLAAGIGGDFVASLVKSQNKKVEDQLNT